MKAEAKVGLFVIVCVLLLSVTVYYVGNDQWGRHLISYKAYLRYAGGVAVGSEVLYGGIAVGRVTAVRPWRQDPTRIEILLDVKEGTPLNEKSVASLGAVSLMASPAISITTGSPEARLLEPGQVVASQESVSIDEMTRRLAGIAQTAGELIIQLQSELKEISGRAETLLANLNDATGPRNRQQIADILRQFNTLVAQQSPKIDRITDQVLRASGDADSAIKKIGPLVERTDATVANVNDTIVQLRDPIRQDLVQLQTSIAQANSLMASIQSVVRGNDDNIREVTENLRVTTENLDQLTGQVKQRPWSLVRIRQPKGRKVPK